ncbi:MAG: hypothetical protein HYV27_22860 [Candidatus Hydrogenedentes bacterium]|nr:hypothetical protein [Candidatus Hydrogenedentota bacterium]
MKTNNSTPTEPFFADITKGFQTHSWVYKTWLTVFRGYTVNEIRKTPRPTGLGFITYQNLWSLQPRDAADSDE